MTVERDFLLERRTKFSLEKVEKKIALVKYQIPHVKIVKPNPEKEEYQHGESLGEFPSHLEEEYATTEYPPSWVK